MKTCTCGKTAYKNGEWGIINTDGFAAIRFCPWCGDMFFPNGTISTREQQIAAWEGSLNKMAEIAKGVLA